MFNLDNIGSNSEDKLADIESEYLIEPEEVIEEDDENYTDD